MYYYLNSFIIYSILGFILESSLYKFKVSPYYSGILFGPFTIIYGFGCIFLIILDKYIFNKINNNILKIVIIYLLSSIVLTLTELSGGLILQYLFHTEMWNYTSKMFNIGKYICLELSAIWGLLGVIFIYVVKPFFDKRVKSLSTNFTKIFISLITINLIITFITKNL
jgi:uncharacterized membrane protein